MLMEYKLDMDVSNKGYVMSIYSIGGVVTQLIIVPFLDSCTKLTNKHLVVCSAVILASLQFMLGLIVSPNLFYAVIVGLAVSSSVLKAKGRSCRNKSLDGALAARCFNLSFRLIS